MIMTLEPVVLDPFKYKGWEKDGDLPGALLTTQKTMDEEWQSVTKSKPMKKDSKVKAPIKR